MDRDLYYYIMSLVDYDKEELYDILKSMKFIADHDDNDYSLEHVKKAYDEAYGINKSRN